MVTVRFFKHGHLYLANWASQARTFSCLLRSQTFGEVFRFVSV